MGPPRLIIASDFVMGARDDDDIGAPVLNLPAIAEARTVFRTGW